MAGREPGHLTSQFFVSKACRLDNRRPAPRHQPHNQGDDKDNQEHEEQYLRDACGRRGHAAEAEQPGDHRDHQKNESPVKHRHSPFAALPEKADDRSRGRSFSQTERGEIGSLTASETDTDPAANIVDALVLLGEPGIRDMVDEPGYLPTGLMR